MPDDVYRHSIPELITRYQFEPTLRDIYVKGQRDQTFLRWFFLRSGMESTVAYEISIINIPDDLVARLGVAGNRERVIALCVELDRAADIAIDSVRGLIDKDFFDILQEPHDARFLLKTDFSCMECYALDIGTLKKFSLIYLGREISSEHLEKLLAIIAEIYVLRAAKQQLAPRAGWVEDFTRSCTIAAEGPVLDRDDFIQKLLQQARGALVLAEYEATIEGIRGQLASDYRQSINGHDAVRMLSWYAHNIGVPALLYNRRPLQRALLSSVEYDHIMHTMLFQRIVAWAAARV